MKALSALVTPLHPLAQVRKEVHILSWVTIVLFLDSKKTLRKTFLTC